jgi:hypothetical protein
MPVNPNVWAGAQSNQTLAPITPGGGKFGSPGTPVVNKQWWEEGLPAGIGYLVDQGADYLENDKKVEIDPMESAFISEFGQDYLTDTPLGANSSIQDDYLLANNNLNSFYAEHGKESPAEKSLYSKKPDEWAKIKSTLEANVIQQSAKASKHKSRMQDYSDQSNIFESDTIFGDWLPNLLRRDLKDGERWADDIDGDAADEGLYAQKWLGQGNNSADYQSWLVSEINEPNVTDERKANLLKYYNIYYGSNK